MDTIYYKNHGLELSKDMLENYYKNTPILFKYRSCYEVVTYKGKNGTEFGLHEVRQLKKHNGLPYTVKGRFITMDYQNANHFIENDFFTVN